MPLTDPQKTAIKAHINADPALAGLGSDGLSSQVIADALNGPSTLAQGTFIVWRTSVPVSEIEQNGFSWQDLDAVPGAKYRIWERLASYPTLNPSKANVRKGIDDFCKDNSNAVITRLRDSIYPHLKRAASRVERLFVTGTGSDVAPGLLGFEGPISAADVESARNFGG